MPTKRQSSLPLIAAIPMQRVGPVKIISAECNETVLLPLATFEAPLWPSTARGARMCTQAGGIQVTILSEGMTRSILLEAASAASAIAAYHALQAREAAMAQIVAQGSRFAELQALHGQVVGPLLYLRFTCTTGEAAGHNMVTLAAEQLLNWILLEYPHLRYVSLSANYCSDKKVSAVNGILGRGKYVVAEVRLSRQLLKRYCQTTPEQLIELNLKKNLIGNLLAGGLRTANAHFANLLLAFYLATGQDAANIVEASQGMVYTTLQEDQLSFSVTLPNLIVGTVGAGKQLDFVQDNLRLLGCLPEQTGGTSARRLAVIAAAAVLCGELSLLAALTNRGELMRSHLALER